MENRDYAPWVRWALVTALGVSGLIVAARVVLDPANPPLNAAGWFGLSAIALALTRAREARMSPGMGWLVAAAVGAALGVVVAAAFWTTPAIYFLSDDFIVVKLANGFRPSLRAAFTSPGGDGFFRPVGNLSLSLSAPWAGISPERWRAIGLALHVANSTLVFALATLVCARRAFGFFAGALFAMHGTRPESAVWIAGRFDLLATLFTLGGLLLLAHSFQSRYGRLWRAASLSCMVLAILSKESAYVFPVLAALLLSSIEQPRRRLRTLIPFAAVATALFAYRMALFGGIGGYRDPQTGASQALAFGPSTLKALFLRVPMALFFPVNWTVPPGSWVIALLIAYMAALMFLAWARPSRRAVWFGAAFLFAAALPPVHLLGIGAGLANSRLLYLPSVGFCILIAAAAEGMPGKARAVVALVALVFHYAALEHNVALWAEAGAKAKASCAVVYRCIDRGPITSGAPGRLHGVPLFANGLAECVEMEAAGRAEAPRADRSRVIWDAASGDARCSLD